MVKFSETVQVSNIIYQVVEKGLPVVVSGNFPKSSGSNETIGHIVVVVGAIYQKDELLKDTFIKPNPKAIIIDDPWGNFMDGYEKNTTGNDVICPWDLFLKYLKPVNTIDTKWAYLFNKGEAIT
jgi:hypothetical protein